LYPIPCANKYKTRQIKIRESFFLRPEKQKNTGKTLGNKGLRINIKQFLKMADVNATVKNNS
jgi:hypothetical protein